ncbi:metalloregulator ArsR/SmtB family transcription factor [Gordonia sp. PP30]|uniref:ArsR/SmtB family transcription factor n=1 Tax=Gordonia sp. PP30 TaxID=2935861 RepID=UPI001FFF5484|nr:metalloregulator ArsR/SmtB family transcription factor [Gordonia sp. PP30]UQE74019.1 metalloregulator ArsR/SmtB family transcription factor [Gordonia sp. PP30]
MGHRMADGDGNGSGALDAATAERVATTLQALATPSRLRILSQLRGQAMAVGDLAAAVQMEPSAVSHQLRLLRNLGLVTGVREGRSIVYSLYDNHVAQLLDEAVYHSEHLRMGLADRLESVTLEHSAVQR